MTTEEETIETSSEQRHRGGTATRTWQQQTAMGEKTSRVISTAISMASTALTRREPPLHHEEVLQVTHK